MSSWIIRRDRLDPDQRRIVDAPINGNMWIAGFAGSGKSVILVHKALSILNSDPSAKILFIVYTQSLVDLFKTGLDALQHPEIEVRTIYDFMQGDKIYDYIFCDEVQDCTDRMIDNMRNRSRKFLVTAGDKFQSIFERDVKYHEPTINPMSLKSTINAQVYELMKIYRLTPSIIDAIDRFLPAMRLNVNGKPNAEKVDVTIKLCKSDNQNQEVEYVYDNAETYLRQYGRTAVLFPSTKECVDYANTLLECKGKPVWEEEQNQWGKTNFGSLNEHLSRYGINLMYIGNGYGSLKQAEKRSIGVMMTYYSAKGLDFENVYLPFLNEGVFISSDDERSRTIFMVAMSRCSKNLTLSYTKRLFNYVESFRSMCQEITPDSSTPQPISGSGDDFDF